MALSTLYRDSLALLTDLYQLTMAYGYWKLHRGTMGAVFNLFFRTPPFGGGYTVASGLASVIDYVQHARFRDDDIDYLATLTARDGTLLFETEFLAYLRTMDFPVTIDAMPEGTVVFPNEPLLRVSGPILACQLLETPLLNLVNFQTLVATKAARVCSAAQGEPVIEFGLRRAQGPDGGVIASRAAYLGGCVSTSNVLAGKLFGIPVAGTHAHSWVMSFDTELESFSAYADVMPHNVIFLVDTYNTLEGVRHAITVGEMMRAEGHTLLGIRLDSGDLAYLSIEARRLLDAHGFQDAVIVGSNELDEYIIESLKLQGAKVNVWGVGTRLATAYQQPALGGIYKLSAIQHSDGTWEPKLKLSEQVGKINIPGHLQVRRFLHDDAFIADMIYDDLLGIIDPPTLVDPLDPTRRRHIAAETSGEDLLVPVFHEGILVYTAPPLAESRRRTLAQLARLHPGIKRLVNPHSYPVGLEQGLHARRTELILRARAMATQEDTGGMPKEAQDE
jgi:nicotinate phosphoribosyltransferase